MSTLPKTLPRDAFIDTIFEAALTDKRIVFLSADLGARALDRFRSDIPAQFIHAGICEQNMIDVAAGLAQCGKTVFVYAMAPFVTLRCFEQIKVALASMHLPACIIGNGVGYSYDDAGPTHYATEDLTCMRSLGGCEILTPSDTRSAIQAARSSIETPALRYVRLDRKHLPEVYAEGDERFEDDGIAVVTPGRDALILAHGYMLHEAQAVRRLLQEKGLDVGIADVYRVKPFPGQTLARLAKDYPALAAYEEHFISGGLGGAVAEALADEQIVKPLLRVAIPDAYLFANGGRAHIHRVAGIDPATAAKRIAAFLPK